ncbi:hypothetical protein [Streptomyces hirsutus]|uniref:hypothetical protein n=1 Tax=Streptomyces hirsutus TaxID=35620 RepID=UPI0006E2F918|nr:hypothetical protein [Streptomyces hirsutus]
MGKNQGERRAVPAEMAADEAGTGDLRPAVPRQSRAQGVLLLAAAMPMGLAGFWLAVAACNHWQAARLQSTMAVDAPGLRDPWWYATVVAAAVIVAGAVALGAVRAVVLRRPLGGQGFSRLRLFLPIMASNSVFGLWGEDLPVPWWDFDLLIPLVAVSAQTLMFGARRLAVLGRQHLAEIIRSPGELRRDSFTLYLRSFEDDVRRTALEETRHPAPGAGAVVSDLGLSSRTEEEQLAQALKLVAPMVAVGRPGERLPLVGARRLYLPIDDWQDTVRDLMGRARLVVMAVGLGPGLLWEFREATRLLPAERLVLLVPGREAYETFRAQAAPPRQGAARPAQAEHAWSPPVLPPYPDSEPPADLTLKGAVYFDAGWAPNFVLFGAGRNQIRLGGVVRGAMKDGLKPVLDRYRPGRHR